MSEGVYYLRLNGKVEGPYSIGQIYDLWAARKINSQTPFARFEEMDKWQPLAELTLKISAPRATAPKASAPAAEQTAPSSPRPRVPPLVVPEDRAAAMLYRREAKAPAKPLLAGLAAGASRNIVFNFSLVSAICIVAGILVVTYFLAFSSSSSDGKDADANLLLLKQTGVIAGMGLVLMGGLLIIARQITQVLLAIKTDNWQNGNKSSSD